MTEPIDGLTCHHDALEAGEGIEGIGGPEEEIGPEAGSAGGTNPGVCGCG